MEISPNIHVYRAATFKFPKHRLPIISEEVEKAMR
jgi:hypothetical protein